MLDLGAGTGSFRVREMMHRIAYPLGVHVRADVNLTDVQASCTDGKERITEVVNLPTTGVNTERIWLLEHFADWFSVNLGAGTMYHRRTEVSRQLMQPNTLGTRDASQISAETAKQLRERLRQEARAQKLAAKRRACAHGSPSGLPNARRRSCPKTNTPSISTISKNMPRSACANPGRSRWARCTSAST